MQQEQKDLLQALYEDYRDSLRLAVLSRGVPECEVDDIIQDTFCAFMRAYKEDALVWNKAEKNYQHGFKGFRYRIRNSSLSCKEGYL